MKILNQNKQSGQEEPPVNKNTDRKTNNSSSSSSSHNSNNHNHHSSRRSATVVANNKLDGEGGEGGGGGGKTVGVELARVSLEYSASSEPSAHKIFSPRVSFGRKPTGPDATCRRQFNLQIKNSSFVSRQHFVMELVRINNNNPLYLLKVKSFDFKFICLI